MENLLLNFLIIALVLCFVAAIVLLIFSSRLPKWLGYGVLTLHAALAATAVFLFLRHNHPVYVSLIFSFTVYTGILLFACIVRNNFALPLKIYASVFLLALPLFVISPSRLITIMTLGHLSASHAGELHLTGDYYLEKEHGMIEQKNTEATYKIIRRMGIFNKTLARNIQINFRPDSVKVLFLDEKSEIRLRVYQRTVSDSTDISVNLINNNTSSDITKKTQ